MKHVDSVILFVFNKNKDKVLMIERVKNHFGFDWGFVCGKFEEGETADECAVRELYEELGLKGLVLKKFKQVKHKKDNETYYHYYYVTTISESAQKINFKKDEIKSVVWFKLNELPKSRAPDDPFEAISK
ncbi:MAG: NUDIX hydrolase [archaeon]|jgi:8-oxo-dGTP diphosphatase